MPITIYGGKSISDDQIEMVKDEYNKDPTDIGNQCVVTINNPCNNINKGEPIPDYDGNNYPGKQLDELSHYSDIDGKCQFIYHETCGNLGISMPKKESFTVDNSQLCLTYIDLFILIVIVILAYMYYGKK